MSEVLLFLSIKHFVITGNALEEIAAAVANDTFRPVINRYLWYHTVQVADD
jgi:hypothetical protein